MTPTTQIELSVIVAAVLTIGFLGMTIFRFRWAYLVATYFSFGLFGVALPLTIALPATSLFGTAFLTVAWPFWLLFGDAVMSWLPQGVTALMFNV